MSTQKNKVLAGMALAFAFTRILPAGEVPAASGWVNISEAFTQQIGVHDISPDYTRRCLGMIVVPTGAVFMQTGKGVCVSADQGTTWSIVESNSVSGRCETGFGFSVAYPYDGRMAFFCIDGTGGITLDGGKTWRPFGKMLRMFEFADVDWSTNDPQTLFGLLHEPFYTVLSTDGGRNWQQLYKEVEAIKTAQKSVSQYLLGVVNADTLVRAHPDQNGISRSTDAGKTWTEVAKYKVLGRRPVHYGNKVYWTTTDGVISSIDGKEWRLTGKGPEKAIFGPYFGNSEQEFMVVSGKAFFITHDGGKTWKDVAPAFFPPDARSKYVNDAGAFNYFGWDSTRQILYASSLGGSVYRLQLSRSRVLIEPSVWFPIVAPTTISPNAIAKTDARGIAPLACQTITKQADGYCSFSWNGLNLPLPANKLLHVPIYLDDFQTAPGYSLSLTIQLTNAGGSIRYNFSMNSFKASGWTYLPLWDPSTPANAVFSKAGSSGVMDHNGFDFSKPVTAISFAPNNLPPGVSISIASIETATKTKPILVITDDITDNSTYENIVPIMEAAGFRGGLRIGGFKESSYAEGNVARLRKAYDNGWDVYNGSWSRGGFNGASTPELFENEITECDKRAKALSFTRGMTWFSGAGNALPRQSICKTVAQKTGLKVLKGGGGMGLVNIIRADGVDDPAILTCVGMGGRSDKPATGKRGESTIVLSSPVALREGTAVSGTGIGVGARIAPHGVHGNTVTLTVPNTDDVVGPVTLEDSFEAHRAIADGLIYTGGALVYFMHDLKPAGAPTNISFPIEDFTQLVAYWKAQSDLGLLDVVTPSQFDALMRER